LALLGADHIFHVSGLRVKSHLLALLGAHHIFHVSRVRVKVFYAVVQISSGYLVAAFKL